MGCKIMKAVESENPHSQTFSDQERSNLPYPMISQCNLGKVQRTTFFCQRRLFRRESQFVLAPQELHVVEQFQKLNRMVFARFYSRFRPMLARLGRVVEDWVRFGSNNLRIGPKTRVQDAEPS